MGNTPSTDTARVVTVSATYGAAGSVIAPRLAEALNVRFLDRTLTSAAAVAMESSSDEERATSPPSRWISSLAQLAATVPGVPSPGAFVTDHIGDMRAEATQQVIDAAATGSVLVLGRAAAVVLEDHPSAFHIRLDGPLEARIARAQSIESIAADEARRRCEVTDRLRALFVQRLYHRDADDQRLYHMVLDSTPFTTDDVVSILRVATLAFWDSVSSSTHNERPDPD